MGEVFQWKKTTFFPCIIRALGRGIRLVVMPYRKHGDTKNRFVYIRYESEHLESLAGLVKNTTGALDALLHERSDGEIQQAVRILQQQTRQHSKKKTQMKYNIFPYHHPVISEQLYQDEYAASVNPITEKINYMKEILKKRQNDFQVIQANQAQESQEQYIRWDEARDPLRATQGINQQHFGSRISDQAEMTVKNLKQKIINTKNLQQKAVIQEMIQTLSSGMKTAQQHGKEREDEDYDAVRDVDFDKPTLKLCVYLSDRPYTDNFFNQKPYISFNIALDKTLHHRFLQAHTHLTDVLHLVFAILYTEVKHRLDQSQKTGVEDFLTVCQNIVPLRILAEWLLFVLNVGTIKIGEYEWFFPSSIRRVIQGASNRVRIDAKQIWLMKYAKDMFYALFT